MTNQEEQRRAKHALVQIKSSLIILTLLQKSKQKHITFIEAVETGSFFLLDH